MEEECEDLRVKMKGEDEDNIKLLRIYEELKKELSKKEKERRGLQSESKKVR